jgi:hypothetical protein
MASSSLRGWAEGQLDRLYYVKRLLAGSDRILLFTGGWDPELTPSPATTGGAGASPSPRTTPTIAEVEAVYEDIVARLAARRPAVDGGFRTTGPAGPDLLRWADTDYDPSAHSAGKKKTAKAAATTGPSSSASEAEQQRGGGWCGCGKRPRGAVASASSQSSPPPRAVVMREGTARSPCADVLRDEAVSTVRVLCVTDAEAALPWEAEAEASPAAAPKPSTLVVLLPATGEQGYGERIAIAKRLIRGAPPSSPVTCFLLMAPYYASRRPAGQRGHYTRFVAEYVAQSLAIMVEGACLIALANTLGAPSAKLVSSGFSWGGAMAGAAGILATSLLPPGVSSTRLCVVPYVGSASPAPLVDGILSGDVSWAALARDMRSVSEARDRLRTLLYGTTVRRFTDVLPPGPSPHGHHIAAVVAVGMLDDHFVPPRFSVELSSALFSVCAGGGRKGEGEGKGKGREVWYGGGHVAAAIHKTERQSQAIVEALGEL